MLSGSVPDMHEAYGEYAALGNICSMRRVDKVVRTCYQ